MLFSVQLEPVQQEKHSSSAVEVAACFSQVRKIWLQLAWPDSAGAFIFITQLTDVSGTCTTLTAATGCHASSSVCVALAEFLQRGRLLLRDDDAEDGEEPAGPRLQELHGAGETSSEAVLGGGGEVNVSQRAQRESCSGATSAVSCSRLLRFSVALLLFLLCVSTSTLCLSSSSSSSLLSASCASP